MEADTFLYTALQEGPVKALEEKLQCQTYKCNRLDSAWLLCYWVTWGSLVRLGSHRLFADLVAAAAQLLPALSVNMEFGFDNYH